MNLAFILIAAASALYAGAFAASMFSLFKQRRSEGPVFYILAAAGFAVHTWAMAAIGLKAGRLPIANGFELLEAVAWAIVLADMSVALIFRIRLAGSLAVLSAAVLAALPLLCPAFTRLAGAQEPDPGAMATAHGILAVAGYSFLALSSVFSCMYLIQLRSLKSRDPGDFGRVLLPLPRLVRFARGSLGASAVLLATSLMLGTAAAFSVSPGIWFAAKIAVGIFVFAAMLSLLYISLKRDMRDAMFAKLCIALFIAAMLMTIPLQMRHF